MGPHLQTWPLFFGGLCAFLFWDTMRKGYVPWRVPGGRNDKQYHRNHYPTMFWAVQLWIGLIALWCIATGLLGTWRPNSPVFVIIMLLGSLVPLGRRFDERRNS